MKTEFLYQNILKLSAFEYGCLVGLHIKEEEKQRRGGALMSNLVSHRWYGVEKLAVPGSSNLNLGFSGAQKKSFLLKRWKKNVLHFVLLN